MSYETIEGIRDTAALLNKVADAMEPNSAGGKDIVLSEWLKIGTEIATQVGGNVIDNDGEVVETE